MSNSPELSAEEALHELLRQYKQLHCPDGSWTCEAAAEIFAGASRFIEGKLGTPSAWPGQQRKLAAPPGK